MNVIKNLGPFFAMVFLLPSWASAQSGYVEDALRYSLHNATGTARISALGGTQNSLGGDISNIHGNPAGLGFFQRSEFNMSLGYMDWNTNSTFEGQSLNQNSTNFMIPNIGVVFSRAKAPLEAGDWRGGSFGFSYNRQSNFRTNYGYSSNRLDQESILDYYLDVYNESGVPGGVGGLFFEAFLINPIGNNQFDFSPNATTSLTKSDFVESEGNLNHISLAYGGNYKNKLFLGANLGILSVNYRRVQTYNEDFLDASNRSTLFSSLQENLYQEGSGINLGLGIIYKPIDQLNLGLSFQSPTWSNINEEYGADIFADFNPPYIDPEFGSIAESDAETELFISNYGLRTPLRLGSGITYFFGKKGFLTADVDYVDYSTANLRSNAFNTGEDNRQIRQLYGQTINYRLGGEARLDVLRIRVGYAYYGDPFQNPGGTDRSMTQLSGGLGVRMPKYSIDLGVVSSHFNSYHTSYPGSPLSTIDNQRLMGTLSLGFNF
ncbi:MAG: long-chain fatty acid transporter [Lunatimonas sp.]|uniref:OmpP1/FadL family transporter n=1 Tax=Lunatimonas sp. TaxID=2060141 RepID=UPI00263A4F3D|nr:long-chain fatty acid transporter [Lunatimonas sp.]MCC5936024.1 long-chain fatty acid transporter [Lunatimonas sp.]